MNITPARSSARFIWLWVLCSTMPMIPFLLPILNDTMGDTPLAYLTWIPVMAFYWGGWNLHRIPFSQERSKFHFASGLFFVIGIGLIIIIWTYRDLALLLWPAWSVGVLWFVAGAGAVKRVWKPMLYLLLVCPPIYLKIVAMLSPSLERFTMIVVDTYSQFAAWIRPEVVPGGIGVSFENQWILVHVSTACSGADSILAVLILLPVMLVVFKTNVTRKILLVVVGSVLAVAANTARILIILTALHYYGMQFALHILHPILGAILFFTTIGLLVIYSSRKFMLDRASNGAIAVLSKARMTTILAVVFIFGACFAFRFLG